MDDTHVQRGVTRLVTVTVDLSAMTPQVGHHVLLPRAGCKAEGVSTIRHRSARTEKGAPCTRTDVSAMLQGAHVGCKQVKEEGETPTGKKEGGQEHGVSVHAHVCALRRSAERLIRIWSVYVCVYEGTRQRRYRRLSQGNDQCSWRGEVVQTHSAAPPAPIKTC